MKNAMRDRWEKTEREARARLGPDRWAKAYAAGRKASIDALIQDIDRAARHFAPIGIFEHNARLEEAYDAARPRWSHRCPDSPEPR